MKIKDKRYDYHITVSAHLLIEKDKKLLLARRPETWEWAPGRWVLIGGKLYSDEAFTDVIKRKTKQELDFELLPKTLYQVKQLIMEEKQAFMYFFTTDYNGQRPSGEVEEYKWFSVDEIEKTPINEFAEYYYKDLLKEF
jgi:ADP-ribose pyrophosphatase YjhB (NUDIX family)